MTDARDLKNMSYNELEGLASEIRDRLLQVVPENGGHLASNLGVVELTLGIYRVVDPYTDRIIWDVGHQCYVHKLLTGRDGDFETLRKFGGMSGFPCSSESEADCFETGHSSTSVSAAAGFARARDLLGQKHKVMAVIGDGALGGGMAFEAINDVGRITNDIVVVLNDNGMSISPNVGGLSKYLRGVRTGKSYIKLKKGVKSFLSKIPLIGKWLVRRIEKLKASIRSLVIPGELFEEFGWKYIGPVDGHDIKKVEKAVQRAFYMGGPVIIHTVTTKGKGYGPAEENPSEYHGVAKKSGNAHPSYSANYGKVLCELSEEHSEITAVCAAMSDGTGLRKFSEEYPDRFFDVGIAEQHAVTMACGLAAGGLRPFVSLYSTFSQRAYDQIHNDCVLQNLPVIFALDRGGICGPDGKTHQGIYDIALFSAMPGITVCAPSCVEEQTEMIRALYNLKAPAMIRYPAKDNSSFDKTLLLSQPVVPGKGAYVCGEDSPEVVFISFGQITEQAYGCVKMLSERNIKASLYNARFLEPFDCGFIDNICGISSVKLIVSVEDCIISGGLGSKIALRMTSEKHFTPLISLGYPDIPIPHGTISEIQKKYKMDAEGIFETVMEALSEA